MKFVPKPENQLIIDWLLDRPVAAIWAGMGLGKTVSTLTAIDYLLLSGDVTGVLLVAPMRVSNLTWPNEVRKWAHLRHMRMANLRTKEGWQALKDGTADIYHINYESLPRLCKSYLEKARSLPFNLLVFDESTCAKNPSSKRINQLRHRVAGVTRRWGLTGTPSPNSLLEIFAQVRLLDEGQRLGRSYDQFKRTYFHPTDYMEYNWVINGPEAKAEIYKRISDIALTLDRRDYADFSEPVYCDIEVPLPPEAKEDYEELERELLLTTGNGEEPILAPNAAVLAGKLLQLTGGAVYNTEHETVLIHEARIKALQKTIKDLRKKDPTRTFLTACNYRHEQSRVARATSGILLEEAPPGILQTWCEGKVPHLICSPQSLGHGLNLQSGGYTILWYSLPWSRELYDQFNARLARRGQDKQVEVYRFISPGTIDDAVAETLRERGEEQKALFEVLTNLRKVATLR